MVKAVINVAYMQKCPTRSRKLKIISQSWNINPMWPHGQWNSAACVRARRSGTFELMQHNPERSTSVLHHMRGIAYAAGHFIHSMCFLYGNCLQTASTTVQFSAAAAAVYHQIWMKRLLWSSCWSDSRSICQSVLFKAGTHAARGYFKGPYHEKRLCFLFLKFTTQRIRFLFHSE